MNKQPLLRHGLVVEALGDGSHQINFATHPMFYTRRAHGTRAFGAACKYMGSILQTWQVLSMSVSVQDSLIILGDVLDDVPSTDWHTLLLEHFIERKYADADTLELGLGIRKVGYRDYVTDSGSTVNITFRGRTVHVTIDGTEYALGRADPRASVLYAHIPCVLRVLHYKLQGMGATPVK